MADITEVESQVTVAYEELDGSPRERLDDEKGLSATREFMCDWADRFTLAGQILGRYEQQSDGSVTRYLPQNYPGRVGVRATRVSIRGEGRVQAGTPSPSTAYKKAILTVEYETDDEERTESGSRRALFTERLSPSVEFMQVQSRGLGYYVPGHGDIKLVDPIAAPPLRIYTMVWEIQRREITTLQAAWLDNVGKVNSVAVTSATIKVGGAPLTFAPETLLYEAPSLEREAHPGPGYRPGQSGLEAVRLDLWRATFRFVWNPHGWNTQPVPDPANGEQIVWAEPKMRGKTNPLKLYESADFTAMLNAIFTYL